MRILIVDDSRIMRNIVKNALLQSTRFAHATCLDASDGAEALRLIKASRIDLLLLDWNMPMMNGLELVKHLRAIEEYARLPIIMVTSEAAKYSVIEAVKAGVNDYIIKPVSERSLLEKINRLGLQGARA
jgi:two-component system chemotaxis response regulator CheY